MRLPSSPQAKEQADYNKAQKAKEALEAEGGDDMAKAAQFLQMNTAKLTKARRRARPTPSLTANHGPKSLTMSVEYSWRSANLQLPSCCQGAHRQLHASCSASLSVCNA